MRPTLGPVLLGCCLLVAGCTSAGASAPAGPAPARPAASPSPTATPAQTPIATSTPSPTASPTPSQPTSPLTGLPEAAAHPVLVVKLDNTRNAQPHAGLRDADVVYLEEVEYGITRIAAVFSSTIPARIGPVRSARITDIDLLAQYGRPAFAFSGAQHKLWPALAKASIIDISPNKGAQGYARDHARRAPYNYFLDGTTGIERAPDATLSHDIGFTFSATPPAGGRAVAKASMEWSEASATFTYDAETGRYRVKLNGQRAAAEEDDAGQHADTVVIQNVKQEPSIYFDKGGGNTPHADTIGSGTAIVMRDGLAYDVTWDRPDALSGTTFTMADGSPMPFKPGQQWVVLLNRKTPAVLKPVTTTSSPTPEATAGPRPSR